MHAGAESWAEHATDEPPLIPPQLHVHGPIPVAPGDAPTAHNSLAVVGMVVRAVPFADPQTPATAGGGGGGGGGGAADFCATQLAVAPPLVPPQVQFQGPVPDIAPGKPTEHSSLVKVGAVDLVVLSAVPHTPATAGGDGAGGGGGGAGGGGGGGAGVAVFCATQLMVAPPLVPLHVQLQGNPTARAGDNHHLIPQS